MPSWIRNLTVSMLFLSGSCFAGNAVTHFVSPHFSATLPAGISAAWKDEDHKLKMYRYLFKSGSEQNHTLQEMRLVIGDIVPKNKLKFDAWQNDTLGTMIAIFIDDHHVSLETSVDQLNQKPTVLMIGQQRFKQTRLDFGDLHAQFLTTTVGNTAYMFTLVNDAKDPVAIAQSFKAMHATIKSANYL